MNYTKLGQRTMQIAKEYVGESETQGPNKSPFINRIMMRFGAQFKGQPWCAGFATWCISEAEKDLKVKDSVIDSPSTSAIAKWARDRGILSNVPTDGCLGLLQGPAYGTGYEHTFLVHNTYMKDGQLWLKTIEGNWRNRVTWYDRPHNPNLYDYVRF